MATNYAYSYATIIERFAKEWHFKNDVRYYRPSILSNIPSAKVVERTYAKASKILRPSETEHADPVEKVYSYLRLIWFLRNGFSSTLRFDSEMEEDGLSFYVTPDYYVRDLEQGTMWYRAYAIKSAHHNLHLKCGVIGVPIVTCSWRNGTISRKVYKEIWLKSWQLFIQSWFRSLPPFQTFPLSDFTNGHYRQPPLLANIQSKGDWDVIGQVPWGQSAPIIERIIPYDPINPNVEVAIDYAASIPLPEDDALDFGFEQRG